MSGMGWRPIDGDNLDELVQLARACLREDGGLGFLFEPDFLRERYFPQMPGAAIGVFAPDESLVACASVYLETPNESQAAIVGLVRPDYRHRGIGEALMQWSEDQAKRLLTSTPAEQRRMLIRTETLNQAAEHLYRAHGFEQTFNELVMARDLRLPLPERTLPEDVTIAVWQADLRDKFFDAYHAAFRERPGFPGWSKDEWIGYVEENDLVPEWTLLALVSDDPAGFVIGNIDLTTTPPGGYIWQVGVVPSQRRRGLASTLLLECMRRMQARGALEALLTVHTNNPGAIEAYRRIGFETVGRRARYERQGAV